LRTLGYSPLASSVSTNNQAVALAFLLALRTGMRAGEICNLTWSDVAPFYVRLWQTKNGTNRDVPLTYRARRLINKAVGIDARSVLKLKTGSLGTMFRRAQEKAGLRGENLTFHDSRHTAATWLSKDLPMLDLCKMFGWRDPSNALIYFNPNPEHMAKHLDSRRQLGAVRSNLDQRFSGAHQSFPTQ
jgi:integrase